LLGALYAALGAFTFSLNNVAMRRGVVTGSVMQGMALTVPIGGASFLVMTVCVGEYSQIFVFPAVALAWLSGQGVVHFVIGRYCNYKSNQLMGVNLAAPVIQLQVPVAMLLAVATLHERFTILQAFGSALMLGGSFTAQRNVSAKPKKVATVAVSSQDPVSEAPKKPVFVPNVISGYFFGFAAAVCYGGSPLMARQAFLHAPGASTLAGGCLAYAAATLFFSLILLKPNSWTDVRSMKSENLPWFLSSAVLVAVSQAFVYASLAVAPLMMVTPILQLSLIFRLFLSQWINRDHEVVNAAVFVGAFTAVLGSVLVSVNTDDLAALFELPREVSDFLRFRLAGY
jgi:drug/metabolite transporter (DMT)-like permease